MQFITDVKLLEQRSSDFAGINDESLKIAIEAFDYFIKKAGTLLDGKDLMIASHLNNMIGLFSNKRHRIQGKRE